MTAKQILKASSVEFVASVLFTFAYLVLLGRTQSSQFTLNILELSALISFIYVVAVFVSSYRFEADLFPFYSVLRALFQKSWVPLYVNIPAQLFGTIAGLAVYVSLHSRVLSLSPLADVAPLTAIDIADFPMRVLVMAVLVFILVYSMIIVRHLFMLKGMTGTIVIAVLVFVLSAITIPLNEVSIVTWWQDTILNIYHSILNPERKFGLEWTDVVTGMVLIGIILLANLKAIQYNRPRNDQYEEPGEYTPSFNRDYDI